MAARSIGGAMLAGLLLTGCAHTPSLDPGLRITVADLVDRIQCELHESLKAQGKRADRLRGWSVAYTLTLTVTDQAGVAPEIVWTPSVGFGTFTLGMGAGLASTAQRQVSLKFTLMVDRLRGRPCDPHLPPPSGVRLDSNVGLEDWLTRVLDAAEQNAFDNFDSFGTVVEFSVEASAKLTPTFQLVPVRGSGTASAKRTDAHKLNIAFDAPQKDPKSEAVRQRSERSLQRQDFEFLLPRSHQLQ